MSLVSDNDAKFSHDRAVLAFQNGHQVSMDVFSTYLSDCLKYLSLIHSGSLAHGVLVSKASFRPFQTLYETVSRVSD